MERAGALPVSAWLRGLALSQAPNHAASIRRSRVGMIAEVMAPLVLAVAKIGNNLNQIARQVNGQSVAGRAINVIQLRLALASIQVDLRQIQDEVRRACEDLSSRKG